MTNQSETIGALAKEQTTMLKDLAAPFPANQISWRPGKVTNDKKKGMALAYIDARDVMDRLDEVCGASWHDEYKEVGGRLVCSITINGITRSDGAGDTAIEGDKGGLSDAFKRAAVKWGIGRYLYRLPSQWVELDQHKNFKSTPNLPPWAMPKVDLHTPLIERIQNGEKILMDLGMHQNEMYNSRERHLKTKVLEDASYEDLNKFKDHLKTKWRQKVAKDAAEAINGEIVQEAN